jgi:hypothetical protein
MAISVPKAHYAVCVYATAAALAFILLGHVYRDTIQKPLTKPFILFPQTGLDWWSVSHFVLFALFGWCVPGRPLAAFSIGVAFELLEDFLASNGSTRLADCGRNPDIFWCKGIQNDYWYMNPTDPWVNLTGYIVGSALRTG